MCVFLFTQVPAVRRLQAQAQAVLEPGVQSSGSGAQYAATCILAHVHDTQAVLASGIQSLAVVLKHAAVFPDHEQAVGQLAKQLGFTQVGNSVLKRAQVQLLPGQGKTGDMSFCDSQALL